MYRAITSREGSVGSKIGRKGVLLARRDNSKFVRDVYEGVISRIADDVPRNDILNWVLDEINLMFANSKSSSDFVVTKSVGNSGGLVGVPFTNEKGVVKDQVGDYIVPALSHNKAEREEQIIKKGATNSQEYYLLCLPAQVQLAERMRRRGQRVDTGTRLEYIVADPDNHTAKQYEKVESIEYYSKYSSIIKMDYFYYLKALANPLDQVLNVAFGNNPDWKEDFVLEQYKFRWKIRHKVLESLKNLFYKPIVLE